MPLCGILAKGGTFWGRHSSVGAGHRLARNSAPGTRDSRWRPTSTALDNPGSERGEGNADGCVARSRTESWTMNDSALITTGLPIALAIIMFGLGLSLTTADFRRVARSPKAVVVALVIQVLLLPAVAFGLVTAFDLDPLLAVGVMLLAASPGGTTANLFSHLFRGDVALNVSLTAINSVLAAFTIPLITNFAIDHFDADGELGLQFGKVVQVIAIVLVPVVIGMLVRRRSLDFATRADRPVRVFSIVVLVIVAVGALLGEREHIGGYLRDVGVVTGLFC